MSTRDRQTKQFSLTNPCFDGLWSSSWINNHERSITKAVFSTVSMFIVLFSWIFGYVFVIISCVLLIKQYYTSSLILFTILFLPYVIPFGRSPKWCRFLMNAAHYFEGGCSWSIESPFPAAYLDPDLRLDDNDNAIVEPPLMFCYHPHGILTQGFLWNGGIRMSAATDRHLPAKERAVLVGEKASHSQALPRHGMAATALINAPIFRPLVVDLCGCVSAAKKSSFVKLLQTRISFGITPGGFFEVSAFERSKDIVCIKQIKGFMKYALKYGYTIYVAYTFGECETYFNFRHIFSESFRRTLSKYHIPTAIFFYGQYWFCPFLPFSQNVGLHTIVGNSVQCPKIANPSQEQIDSYHKKYVHELTSLFDRNKWRFGLENTQLIVN